MLGDPIEVTGIAHDVSFKPGTRVFDRMALDLTLADGRHIPIEAQSVGRA